MIINYEIPKTRIPSLQKCIISILVIGLTFLSIRGGLKTSPINQSMAYFSNTLFLNHAAVNTGWNLLSDILDSQYGNKNPYLYYSTKEAAKIVDQLYQAPKDINVKIFNTHRPNIVLIILESFTADVIESLGGEKSVAPNMEKLIKEGLFFDQIYASGDRTDKSIIAVLSAFPSQATKSIIKSNRKHEKLPAIAQVLTQNDYQTSFYYGGQSEFFNFKSYVLSHNYKTLVDEDSFNQKIRAHGGTSIILYLETLN